MPRGARQRGAAVLARHHVDAEDLAGAVGVDRGRDEGVHGDRAPALARLLGGVVEPDERVGAGVERPVANAATGASRLLAISETRLFDRLVMPSVLTSLATRQVETPGR